MNKMHPLHSIQYVVDSVRVTGEYLDSTRRTGRSTALALKFIAQAIENPYKVIQVRDHSNSTGARQVSRDVQLVYRIAAMCSMLRLEKIQCNTHECTITFGEVTKASSVGKPGLGYDTPTRSPTSKEIQEAWAGAFSWPLHK